MCQIAPNLIQLLEYGVVQMPVRKRALKPDPMGRYRPYLGYRIDGKQQRFNLGTDKIEAERRFNRLFELWGENVRAAGKEVWCPLALAFARQVAEGKRRIEYPLSSQILEADDPAAEYSHMIHVERERFPSLDIVAADTEVYALGLKRNNDLVGNEIERLQSRLQELGALAQK